MADKPVDSPDVGWYAKTFGSHAAPDLTGRIVKEQMQKGWAIIPPKRGATPLAATVIGMLVIQAPIHYLLDEPEIPVNAQNTEILSNDLDNAHGYRAGHFRGDKFAVIIEHDEGMYRVYTAPTDGTADKADWTFVSDPVRATGLLSEFANVLQRKMQALDGDFTNLPPHDPHLIQFRDITRVYNDPEHEGVIQRRSAGESIGMDSAQMRATYGEVLGELGVAMQGISGDITDSGTVRSRGKPPRSNLRGRCLNRRPAPVPASHLFWHSEPRSASSGRGPP